MIRIERVVGATPKTQRGMEGSRFMAHESEAACLLRTGNLYPRRVGWKPDENALVFAGVKHGAFSLYFDDEPFFHFDLEGRWQRVFEGETHYRKALDGGIDAIDRVRQGPNLILHRRTLAFAEAADLDARVRAKALNLLAELNAARGRSVAPDDPARALDAPELTELLERIIAWDSQAWFRHREQYQRLYGPIPFLPPDAHQSVVLQATVSNPGSESEVRSPDEFAAHLKGVAALLGRRLAQCRAVFLAGPDVLRLPAETVRSYFQAIHAQLPIDPKRGGPQRRSELAADAVRLSGIDASLDDFRAPFPDKSFWTDLRDQALGRVTLGVDSGLPALRGTCRLDWSNAELAHAVSILKEAGVPLGVVLHLGSGDHTLRDAHETATVELVAALPLEREDLIYIIDAEELDQPRSESDRAEQQARLKSVVAQRTKAKIVPYSVEKQWN